MPRDDELVAYLAGDGEGQLSPEEISDLDELRAVLGDTSTWSEPPPGLEDSVVAAITAEARQAPPVIDFSEARERRRRRRLAGMGAAILAAAAAVAAFAVFGPDSNRPDFAMALQATELAPGASGHADLTQTPSGWRIELDATGLPRLDNGQFYEAWLKKDTILVPIGTFNQGTKVTLWAGVPVSEFRSLTITIEKADGEQGSSGQRVLVGTVNG
jgi:hypothetical protein